MSHVAHVSPVAKLAKPRAIFFGTPAFAVPCLDALHVIADVALVITQPDKPQGRGLTVAACPVKARALELGLRVESPSKVRTAEFAAMLREVNADVAVVVAYGRILTAEVLAIPRLGCVNVHASLLPRWRGAAPINWAIVHGDAESGVTLMQMDEGMDTGAMLFSSRVPIGPDETASELSDRLSQLGATVLSEQLPRYLAGALVAEPQPSEGVTLAPIIDKSDGQVDWSKSAAQIHDHCRGFTPWPGAFTFLKTQKGTERVKLHKTRALEVTRGMAAEPGAVVQASKGISVATGDGVLAIDELQLEGRKRMTAEAFVAGSALKPGQRFCNEDAP